FQCSSCIISFYEYSVKFIVFRSQRYLFLLIKLTNQIFVTKNRPDNLLERLSEQLIFTYINT
ncbi:MAG: hypothetical protein AAB795_02975, partial [Patescibacteria group bacterium]